MTHSLRSIAVIATLAAAANAHAVSDARGDILPSFAGDRTVGAFDILSSDVTFDAGANVFLLHARTAGPIAGAAGAAYVFGFNTGGVANSPFGDIGIPDVSFNASAVLRADGTGAVGAHAIASTVVGNDIFASVSASLLPSNGLEAEDFTWALWSIDGAIHGNFRNADFAPDANTQVAAVPEPETYALMLTGLGVLGFVGRRRSRTGCAA